MSQVTGHESRPVVETALPLSLYTKGKVRDVYEVDGDLLIIATDRLSAFDQVLPTPIPDKGRVLTQLSAFWFDRTRDIVSNHMRSVNLNKIVAHLPQLRDVLAEALEGRTMLVRRCEPYDVECVVRGYITGSAWEEYRQGGTVGGMPLPTGLRNGDRLPKLIFTPATKSARGHDENISLDQMRDLVGADTTAALREISLALYERAAAHARMCGLLLADTKFEFGRRGGRITLIDEALTPDSSRYWDAAQYPLSLVSFDKQFVRDYLNTVGWNHEPPAPALPAMVVKATRHRYFETLYRITRAQQRSRQ